MSDSELKKAVEIITEYFPGTVLSGAGISVDSGIPPFRGSGGLWEKYDPEEYVSISGFIRNPEKIWQLYIELGKLLLNSKPNPGHNALAEMEKRGYLNGIITQNIDGLHFRSGSAKVVEFHGSSDRAVCIKCYKTYFLDEKKLSEKVPRCDCGEVLKPDIVFFGELIPRSALLESQELIEDSRFILVVGTSAVVYPANQLPMQIKRRGGKIIEVNTEPTPLTQAADVSLLGSTSEILPKLVKLLPDKTN
jgi:NAD-dependent deacetylase